LTIGAIAKFRKFASAAMKFQRALISRLTWRPRGSCLVDLDQNIGVTVTYPHLNSGLPPTLNRLIGIVTPY
jgi:hypothetical protein